MKRVISKLKKFAREVVELNSANHVEQNNITEKTSEITSPNIFWGTEIRTK
jgi:hypothetical protein